MSYIPSTSNLSVTSVSAAYTVLTTDQYVEVTALAALTVTLPASAGSGQQVTVKNLGPARVTVAAAGTDKIDGVASFLIKQVNEAITLVDAVTGKWEIM